MKLRDRIKPWAQDWAMRFMDDLRPETLDEARGEVLEIGFGTGRNLRHYSNEVRSVWGIDPMTTEGVGPVERRIARAPFSDGGANLAGMSLLRRGLSLIWEAPQTALGAAMLGAEALRSRVVNIELDDGRLVVESKGTGISLGYIVFWSRENSRWHDLDIRNRAHELGHTKQSRLLGWLYLPVIGLPSISRAAYALAHREVTGRQWTRYYEGYPENWADRLGGVIREKEQS